MPPTAAWTIWTRTSEVDSFCSEPTSASCEPCTSVLMMSGRFLTSPSAIWSNMSMVPVPTSLRSVPRGTSQVSSQKSRSASEITARWPGHMVHLDVKKVGRIPDGGGWRIHGRNSDQARTAGRAKSAGAKRGYTYLHSAVDGFSRLSYTEPLTDEKGTTAAAFLARAKAWFAAHGITRMEHVVTDNGSCYRSAVFREAVGASRHQRITPYAPRHNGKVERYNRIVAEELLYARMWHSEAERAAVPKTWNRHYNYHRPHGAHDGQPPASATPTRVSNVMASYS